LCLVAEVAAQQTKFLAKANLPQKSLFSAPK